MTYGEGTHTQQGASSDALSQGPHEDFAPPMQVALVTRPILTKVGH